MARNLQEWLNWMAKYHDQAIDLGLHDISRIAVRLGLHEFNIPVITVAGTNGKGSCVASMEALLIQQGKRVGSYTSPHLWQFTERIKINAIPITPEQCCQAFAVVELQLTPGEYLTFFEFATLAALWFFKGQKLDVLLLEVGLGGRLDAVNIVSNNIAVITSIAIDHQKYLGDTREKIAFEKAGIIQVNTQHVICSDNLPPAIIRQRSEEVGASYFQINAKFADYKLPKLTFPWQNAAAAIVAVNCILDNPLPQSAIDFALQNLFIPGRYQRELYHDIELVFDVAHNAQAVSWLVENLKDNACFGENIIILGISKDKELTNIIAEFDLDVYMWFTCQPQQKHMYSATEIAELLYANKKQQSEVVCCYTVAKALQGAIAHAAPGDRIVIFGSFYTVAEAMLAYNDLVLNVGEVY